MHHLMIYPDGSSIDLDSVVMLPRKNESLALRLASGKEIKKSETKRAR
jgi:hypothetical protein